MNTAAPRWVDDDAGMRELVEALRSQPEYGLDTEFVAEKSYWPRLCLAQVSWPGGVALVDALACDVQPLREILEGPATMVTHAGAADLPILERACGARPTVLFDTQLAAGFVGLGLPSLSVLVSSVLGIRLDKKEQLTDWARRPLSGSAQAYAASDVLHLLPLTAALRGRLASAGREEWAAAETELLRTLPTRDQDPDTAWWRIKGSRSFRGEHAAVAQAVAAWRERRAQELDRPARFVLSELVLAGLAARPPRTARELGHLRGAESLPKAVATAVVEAVEAGRAMPRSELRLPPRHDDDAALDAAVGLLVAWTAQEAAREGIEARLLGTRDDVRALVNGRPNRLDDGWRAEMVGNQIRQLVAGGAVLRLVDGGRRVRLESGS
ncbi:MAG: HRDC domain-containing protein [Acidimicrobiia bacterium]